jgi:hypothetical protein
MFSKNCFFTMVFLFLICPVVFSVSLEDKAQIQVQLKLIEISVNYGDAATILEVVSPNARAGLKEELTESFGGKAIEYEQRIDSFEDLEDKKVRVTGSFSASGNNWKINGISNYFIFEKINGSWFLTDTDFHQKTNPEYVFNLVGSILSLGIPFFLFLLFLLFVLFIFWAWMLLDLLGRNFEDKTTWLLVVIFLGFFGAGLYFFIKRKKLISLEMQHL